MKILLFFENTKPGGLDTFVVTLAKQLACEDIEVIIICNKNHPGLPILRSKLNNSCRLELHGLPIRNELFPDLGGRVRKQINKVARYFSNPILFLLNVFRLRQIFASIDADRLLVINGGYPGGDTCRAATIAWGIDFGKVPAWHNFHNLTQTSTKRFADFDRIIDVLVREFAGGFISVSNACSLTLRSRAVFASTTPLTIYNGIEPVLISKKPGIRNKHAIASHDILIVQPAVYEPRKGHAFIFKALETVWLQHKNVYLLCSGFGTSEEIDCLEHLRKSSTHPEKILLTQHITDIGEILAEADLLVVGSQAYESFGLTCVEAMSCGVPVIGTNVGGVPEVIEHLESGIVVNKDRPDLFGKAILEIIENKDKRHHIIKSGFLRYSKFFTAPRMAEEYLWVIGSGHLDPIAAIKLERRRFLLWLLRLRKAQVLSNYGCKLSLWIIKRFVSKLGGRKLNYPSKVSRIVGKLF